jgi:hypothetical protein
VNSDGTVVLTRGRPSDTRRITGLNNAVAVASGSEIVALTRDGRVFEIDRPILVHEQSNVATEHAGLSSVVGIAAGNWRCLALTSDGTVTVLSGDGFPDYLNVPKGLKNVIGIAAGDMFCLALQTNSPNSIPRKAVNP